jgi:hypothetical protein
LLYLFFGCGYDGGLFLQQVDVEKENATPVGRTILRIIPACSSVTPHVRAGDLKAAVHSFLLYDVANGKHLNGMETRRKVEIGWFLK